MAELISIIVPTLNEAANLPTLAERINAALAGQAYELIVVDDNSPDGTPAVCAELAQRFPLCLIVRPRPRNGLGGAVLEGFAAARGDVLVVMDADLQHPPEKIPELLAALEAGADFALGSRYVPGGATQGKWTLFRRLNSWLATLLARPFAGNTHDPMSGFFALERATYDRAQRLTPLGYKIGLELMCKCRVRRPAEVPIHFGQRLHGQSKLSLKEQFRYLEHLSRLYDFTFPRAAPIAKFLIVLAAAWLAGAAAYALFKPGMDRHLAVIAAYAANVLVTALFHVRYVRTQREFLLRRRPSVDFALISLLEWLACAVAAAWLRRRAPAVGDWELLILCFAAATVVRYVLRKELLQDIRGLRAAEPRLAETGAENRP